MVSETFSGDYSGFESLLGKNLKKVTDAFSKRAMPPASSFSSSSAANNFSANRDSTAKLIGILDADSKREILELKKISSIFEASLDQNTNLLRQNSTNNKLLIDKVNKLTDAISTMPSNGGGVIGAGIGNAIGNAIGGGSSRLGRNLRVGSGLLAGAGAAYSVNNLSDTRNTPFFGNENTGLSGSRAASYGGAAINGALAGAAIAGPYGALAGGAVGLGAAAYNDFKPEVDKKVSEIASSIIEGSKSLWKTVGTTTKAGIDYITSNIPSKESVIGFVSGAAKSFRSFASDLGTSVGNMLNDVMEWIKSKIPSVEDIKKGASRLVEGSNIENLTSPNNVQIPGLSPTASAALANEPANLNGTPINTPNVAQRLLNRITGRNSGDNTANATANPSNTVGMINPNSQDTINDSTLSPGERARAQAESVVAGSKNDPNAPKYNEKGNFGKGDAFTQKAPEIISRLQQDFGLTKEQAAGVVGNLGHESGGFKYMQEINPVNGGRGGLGWAQWTGPRRDAFEKYAKDNGLDPKSDAANYGFLKQELQTSEKGAIAAVKKETTVAGASKAFEGQFERADARYKHYEEREKYGNQGLAAYEKAEKEKANKPSDNPIDKTQAVAQNTPTINKDYKDTLSPSEQAQQDTEKTNPENIAKATNPASATISGENSNKASITREINQKPLENNITNENVKATAISQGNTDISKDQSKGLVIGGDVTNGKTPNMGNGNGSVKSYNNDVSNSSLNMANDTVNNDNNTATLLSSSTSGYRANEGITTPRTVNSIYSGDMSNRDRANVGKASIINTNNMATPTSEDASTPVTSRTKAVDESTSNYIPENTAKTTGSMTNSDRSASAAQGSYGSQNFASVLGMGVNDIPMHITTGGLILVNAGATA